MLMPDDAPQLAAVPDANNDKAVTAAKSTMCRWCGQRFVGGPAVNLAAGHQFCIHKGGVVRAFHRAGKEWHYDDGICWPCLDDIMQTYWKVERELKARAQPAAPIRRTFLQKLFGLGRR